MISTAVGKGTVIGMQYGVETGPWPEADSGGECRDERGGGWVRQRAGGPHERARAPLDERGAREARAISIANSYFFSLSFHFISNGYKLILLVSRCFSQFPRIARQRGA